MIKTRRKFVKNIGKMHFLCKKSPKHLTNRFKCCIFAVRIEKYPLFTSPKPYGDPSVILLCGYNRGIIKEAQDKVHDAQCMMQDAQPRRTDCANN